MSIKFNANTSALSVLGGDDVVYVKSVLVEHLPEEVQEKIGELGVVFSVHDAKGVQLAIVADRQLAYALARQYDKVPYTVH